MLLKLMSKVLEVPLMSSTLSYKMDMVKDLIPQRRPMLTVAHGERSNGLSLLLMT